MMEPSICSFIKQETLAQVISCEFCGISMNAFFTEHLWATASVLTVLVLLSERLKNTFKNSAVCVYSNRTPYLELQAAKQRMFYPVSSVDLVLSSDDRNLE